MMQKLYINTVLKQGRTDNIRIVVFSFNPLDFSRKDLHEI